MATLQDIQERIKTLTEQKDAEVSKVSLLTNELVALKLELKKKGRLLQEHEAKVILLTDELLKLEEQSKLESAKLIIPELTDESFKAFASFLVEYAKEHDAGFFNTLCGYEAPVVTVSKDNKFYIRGRNDLLKLYSLYITNACGKENVIGFTIGSDYTSIEDWCTYTGLQRSAKKFIYATILYKVLIHHAEKSGVDAFEYISSVANRSGKASGCCIVYRDKSDLSADDIYTVDSEPIRESKKALIYENNSYQLLLCDPYSVKLKLVTDIIGDMQKSEIVEVFADMSVTVKEV